jgi:SAM-dependent methyltransferase
VQRVRNEPFARIDAADDARFYSVARNVVHLEPGAIEALRSVYAELFPPGATVLDLMSSWRSHLPDGVGRVVGLGMNAEEMEANPQLDEWVVHDLNRDPPLPFADASFDTVACAVSVQYLVHPHEVFADVSRVLVPGGPLVVSFSNRCFPTKAVVPGGQRVRRRRRRAGPDLRRPAVRGQGTRSRSHPRPRNVSAVARERRETRS